MVLCVLFTNGMCTILV